MALQGTLDLFGLADVLHLLAGTRKTGRLFVMGDRGSGSIWMQSGQVTSAACATSSIGDGSVENVIFELLRFAEGEFQFEPDVISHTPGDPVEVQHLLDQAGERLARWREIEAVVPSLDLYVSLADHLPTGDVLIDAGRWELIARIGGGRSIVDLAVATRSDEFSISLRVKELLEQGLIELSQPPADRLDTMPFADEGAFAVQKASSVEGVFPAEGSSPDDGTAPADDMFSMDDAVGAQPGTPIDQVVDTVDAVATWQYDPLSGDTRPAESDAPPRGEVSVTSSFLTGPELMPPPADLDAPAPIERAIAAVPPAELDQAHRDQAHRDQDDDVSGRYSDPPPSGQHGAGEFGVVIPGYSTLSKPIVEEYVEPEIDDHDGPVELGNLTPAAARAIAAAAQATNEAEREAAIDRAIALNDEPLDRRTLIRFLTSVRS
jgi:hypothetical protein